MVRIRCRGPFCFNRRCDPTRKNGLHDGVAPTSLPDLLDGRFELTGRDRHDRAGDKLLGCKARLEKHLAARETAEFSLSRSILLYALANSYFEGQAAGNNLAARSMNSKENRTDCPLVPWAWCSMPVFSPSATRFSLATFTTARRSLTSSSNCGNSRVCTRRLPLFLTAGQAVTISNARRFLQAHSYSAICLPTKDGKLHSLRRPGLPDQRQAAVYQELGIDLATLPVTRTTSLPNTEAKKECGAFFASGFPPNAKVGVISRPWWHGFSGAQRERCQRFSAEANPRMPTEF